MNAFKWSNPFNWKRNFSLVKKIEIALKRFLNYGVRLTKLRLALRLSLVEEWFFNYGVRLEVTLPFTLSLPLLKNGLGWKKERKRKPKPTSVSKVRRESTWVSFECVKFVFNLSGVDMGLRLRFGQLGNKKVGMNTYFSILKTTYKLTQF